MAHPSGGVPSIPAPNGRVPRGQGRVDRPARSRPRWLALLSWVALGSLLLAHRADGLAHRADGGGAGARGEGWDLEAPAPVIPFRPEKLTGLDALDCGQCHTRVVEEWSTTAHALAWVDEVYREEIAERARPELCTACHIPEPLLATGTPGRPRARTDDLHFGVSCESCHLGPDGAWLGASGIETDAHPTARSEFLSAPGSNALCYPCHSVSIGPVVGIARDFVQAGMEERGRSCVGCHMAEVELEDGRVVRSHALQTPRDPTFLARAFVPSVRVEGQRTIVTIANAAGHRVPGLRGRFIDLVAEVLDGAGETLARGELAIDVARFLPVDGELEIEVEAIGAAVRLTGMHTDPRQEEAVPFLDLQLEVPAAKR